MFSIMIQIDPETVNRISRPIVGEGGFQDILKYLQSHLIDNKLIIDSTDFAERIIRYTEKYGDGGFEGRLREIAEEIKHRMNENK